LKSVAINAVTPLEGSHALCTDLRPGSTNAVQPDSYPACGCGEARACAADTEIMNATNTVAMISCALPETSSPRLAQCPPSISNCARLDRCPSTQLLGDICGASSPQ